MWAKRAPPCVAEHLELEIAAVPEALPQARAAITELCAELDLDDDVVERVRIAVTEACGNCVRHAYGPSPASATYMLETHLDADALVVVVHDYGVGIVKTSANAGLGLGLRLIEELSESVDVSSRAGHGTRVAMRFPVRSVGSERLYL